MTHGRKGQSVSLACQRPSDYHTAIPEDPADISRMAEADQQWFRDNVEEPDEKVRAEFDSVLAQLEERGIKLESEPVLDIAPRGAMADSTFAQTRQDFKGMGNVGVARHQIDINPQLGSPFNMKLRLGISHESYRIARKDSVFMQSLNMQDILIHEMGHVLAGSTGYWKGGGKVNPGHQWTSIWNRWNKTIVEMRRVWGRYATKDWEEFYAEAFLLWVKDDDPIVTPDVANLLREENVLGWDHQEDAPGGPTGAWAVIYPQLPVRCLSALRLSPPVPPVKHLPSHPPRGLLGCRPPHPVEGDHGLRFLPPEGFRPTLGGRPCRKHHPGGQDHDQLDHGRKGNGRPGVQEAPVLTYRQERARARAAWEKSVIAAAEAWQQDHFVMAT